MNRSDPKQSVRELLEEAHPALIGLSHWIHANPELGFEEHHASDWVNEWLQTAGFQVERGVADMPTALVGRFGTGPLHVAICVEYDALPEVGHACGHNVIAAAGVGAGLALASVADELGLRVSVMGTPAEESGGGKLRFIEAGYFSDVHAAAMVHPWPVDEATPDIIAITQLDVTYRGHEAHAAGFPHRGRNAADALVIAQTAIGLLRQQLLPTDRVHGIVTKGGDAPNIIPAHTNALFMVRARNRERLEELTTLVRHCFEAGALATGTEVEVVEGTRYANMVHDADLAALYRHNAERLGRVFDDAAGAPVSTDMGDVSHVVPSIHPMIGIESAGAVNHQREFADACATASADLAILDGALGLAWTVIDAAQDQVIRARLLGEAEIREAVAMVEEVQELDAHADVLEDLAASIAETDPELAGRIEAAADALESHADELAEAADTRFEHAQELADDALLDEVAGELESDAEDMVAAIRGIDLTADDEAPAGELSVVEVLAVVEVTEAAEEASAEAPGTWVPASELVTDESGPEVTFAFAEVEDAGEALADTTADAGPAWQAPLDDASSAWEEQVTQVTAASDAELERDMTLAEEAPVTREDRPVAAVGAALGGDHASWERDFLDIARHAAWEEHFSDTLTLAEPAEPEQDVQAVAEAEVLAEAEQEIQAVAEAEPEAVAVAEAEVLAEPEPEAVAVAEAEQETQAVAEAKAHEPTEVVAAPVEPGPETVRAWDLATDTEPPVTQEESETFLSVDDIWYSGAPDDELPPAELVSNERIAIAATNERSDEFVWIPADDEDR